MEGTNFSYEITEHIKTLSERNGYTLEMNYVSYNGKKPKLDIRRWNRRNGGEQMMKGITLSDEEATALLMSLQETILQE